jgi:hypothetical protein
LDLSDETAAMAKTERTEDMGRLERLGRLDPKALMAQPVLLAKLEETAAMGKMEKTAWLVLLALVEKTGGLGNPGP